MNLVLTILFTEHWGPHGVVKAAPSNKAARGILGKTLHAATQIGANPMHINSLNCDEKTEAALTSLWASAGALVIDEIAQGAAALYHALALRSTYGRTATHRLDIAEYAKPATALINNSKGFRIDFPS